MLARFEFAGDQDHYDVSIKTGLTACVASRDEIISLY